MRRQITLAIVAGLVFGAWCARAGADDKEQHQAQIRAIVEAWRARQAQVKTLTCTTSVDSFFSKGYLSDIPTPDKPIPDPKAPAIPEADKTFSNESCSWAVDFSSQRLKKDSQVTGPFLSGKDRLFFLNKDLYLLSDGKCHLFHPKEIYPHTEANDKAFSSDVDLYEDVSHPPHLSFSDMPLLWAAGGVSGKLPTPEELQFSAGPDAYSWRGEAEWQGRPCVVLTTQEQASPTTLREFWVGPEEPYPIYYCRYRNGDRVYWQLEVEYKEQDNRTLPARWTFTEYNRSGKSFHRQVYSVLKMTINAPLPAGLFQKKLEPGQIVYDVAKQKELEVDAKGALVPYNPVKKSTNTLMWMVLGAAALVVVVAAAYFASRLVRRRTKT